MGFDWFTFIAQLVNFLILLWLLRRFLYGPITRVMKEWAEKVAAGLAEAKEREAQAEEALASYAKQSEELEGKRQEILRQVQKEAEDNRRQFLSEARAEVQEARNQWQLALLRERENFLQALRRRSSKEVYVAMRQALRELADVELERHIVTVFLERLAALPEPQRQKMLGAIKHANNELMVRSAFELPDAEHKELNVVLHELLGEELKLHFLTTPELICGIELSAHGYKLAWSVDSYLSSLEATLEQLLASSTSLVKDRGVGA